MGKYYQEEIETASREEILKIQNEKIVKQVKHVYENVPYYRNLMDEKGVKPEDIKSVDDIKKLPFLSKADLRDAYPYGLLGTDLKNCVRIHSTSGTTGRRVVAFYTQHDVDLWEECCARAIVAAGGTKDDVIQIAYGYGLFTGGFGVHGGSQKAWRMTGEGLLPVVRSSISALPTVMPAFWAFLMNMYLSTRLCHAASRICFCSCSLCAVVPLMTSLMSVKRRTSSA